MIVSRRMTRELGLKSSVFGFRFSVIGGRANAWIVLALGASLTGCSVLRRGQNAAAITEARQFSLRGADALQSQRYDDAETLFAEALRRSPSDERAHWGMAEVQWHRGDCAMATEHMLEASRMSGNNPDFLVRLGEMHLEAGRFAQALTQAESALAANRQHAGAWELLGRIHQEQQQWQKAIECYHRAMMSKPNNATVQLALAGIYQRLGRPQRALATLERMTDHQSPEYQSAQVWLLKGQALASLGQIEDARLCMREAATGAAPNDTQIFLQLARLQAEFGELAEARMSLGRVLSVEPDNVGAIALQQTLTKQFATLVSSDRSVSAIPTAGGTLSTGPRSAQ